MGSSREGAARPPLSSPGHTPVQWLGCKWDEAHSQGPTIDFRCLTTGKLYNPIN